MHMELFLMYSIHSMITRMVFITYENIQEGPVPGPMSIPVAAIKSNTLASCRITKHFSQVEQLLHVLSIYFE